MPRIRELGIYESALPPGPLNAITDVAGVAVGHTTLIRGEPVTSPDRQPGDGPFRTGVTVVLPHTGNLYEEKVAAAVHTINGYGKPIGFEQVRELGLIESPIAMTGTLNAPRVADALITLAIEQNPHIGLGFPETHYAGYNSVNVVVGETNDGWLSDLQGRPIGLAEVRAAIAAATCGPVAEGAVGAGTGTSCFGWKGGIGTASRVLSAADGGYTVGALLQTNFGSPEELTICGVPVGRVLRPGESPVSELGGSVMIVLATDAPLDSRALGRLCGRAAFGLARTGSTGHGGSGDFVIAFSTAGRVPDRPDSRPHIRSVVYDQPLMNAFSVAVIEVVEEAVYNSLLMAETTVGRQGHTRYGLPAEDVRRVVLASRGG